MQEGKDLFIKIARENVQQRTEKLYLFAQRAENRLVGSDKRRIKGQLCDKKEKKEKKMELALVWPMSQSGF